MAEFVYLGGHHKCAVPGVRVVRKVILVIRLGRAVVGKRRHFGGDGGAEHFVLRHLADHGVGHFAMLGPIVVDAAAVLRAHIVALAVQGGRVVGMEEDLQDFLQADFVSIERQAHDLGMACVALADLLVSGIDGVAIGVATFHVGNAAHTVKHRLGAPEAAAAQSDGLQVHGC